MSLAPPDADSTGRRRRRAPALPGPARRDGAGAILSAVDDAFPAISCWCAPSRSEEHTSELQSLMRISYAVFCLNKKTNEHQEHTHQTISLTHNQLTIQTNLQHAT